MPRDEDNDLWTAFAKAPETAKEKHTRTGKKHRVTVLDYLQAHIGERLTSIEISEATGIKNAQARIAELVEDGWDIEGAGVLPLRDGVQQYRLASHVQGAGRGKDWGVTLTGERSRLVVRAHMHATVPQAALDDLVARLTAEAARWQAEQGHAPQAAPACQDGTGIGNAGDEDDDYDLDERPWWERGVK